MASELKHVIEQMLTRRESIGPALWELLWLMSADSGQLSIPAIAKGLRKSPRRVSQNLGHLESKRLVEVTRVPGKPSRYKILLGEDGNAC